MIASLPMYDWPEVRQHTNAWWAGLRDALRDEGFRWAPDERLPPQEPARHWLSPDLLLSQTCGYPLTHDLAGKVRLVATPVYGVEGCEGTDYSSAIIVAEDASYKTIADLEGKRAAYNTPDSMSGHLALRAVVAPHASNSRFFNKVVESGAHVKSMELVRKGKADVAAIDCVSWALARRYVPRAAEGLRVLCYSPKVPALPYITRTGWSQAEFARLKRALASASASTDLAQARSSLFIERLEFTDLTSYQHIVELEARCDANGYTRLA